jgi:tetratricopeptide (TPR) repeat protein
MKDRRRSHRCVKALLIQTMVLGLAALMVDGFTPNNAHCRIPKRVILRSRSTDLSMSLFGGGESSRRRRVRFPRLRGDPSSQPNQSEIRPPLHHVWEVYVDQSKPSLDRGGSATLDAFLGLAPPTTVRIMAATLMPTLTTASGSSSTTNMPSSSSNKKTKGPMVRCMSTDGTQCLEVSNVDSVDKVYRVLTKHLKVGYDQVPYRLCECLKWKYKGNAHLEAGKFDDAVEAYNEALRIVSFMGSDEIISDNNATNYSIKQQVQQQKGILLLMRATAYLQRASSHKTQLQTIVQNLMKMVPDAAKLRRLFEQTASLSPAISHSMFRKVMADSMQQEECFRRTQYWHGLYQYALLQAAQDVLQATQLLPHYSRGWARAGEILEELWKLSESAQYYEQAVQCDSNLELQLKPVIERLRKRQDLLESARAYGWSEDTLRLALDVAG